MRQQIDLLLLITSILVWVTAAQDYQVADISCLFPVVGRGGDPEGSERLVARLRKPPGFKGHPLFADDRRIDAFSNPVCQIRPDPLEPSGLIYNLVVHDFTRCAAVRKDGYVHVRVWFPQLVGVVLATDQEVVIMCQPASPTVIQNRAAGFAGAIPSQGRVSGVVEESPGRLEYEVALFRESQARSGPLEDNHALVDQAVPIGSRLQLRARINTKSAWKYAKLIGVTVSGDQGDPFSPGHVELVKEGCRLPEFASIVPQQPRRPEDLPGEVQLDFEAFMLDSKLAGSSKLWIHATIKACVEAQDCLPEFCLDLFQPSGHGRRRRSVAGERPPVLLEVGGDHSLSLAYVMRRKRHPLQETDEPEEEDAPDMITQYLQEGPFEKLLRSNSSTRYPRRALSSTPSTAIPLSSTSTPSSTTLSTTVSPRSMSDKHLSTNLADNVGVTVIMPDEFFSASALSGDSCPGLLVTSGVLGACAMVATAAALLLMAKLRRVKVMQANNSTLSSVLQKEHFQQKTKYPSVRYLLQ